MNAIEAAKRLVGVLEDADRRCEESNWTEGKVSFEERSRILEEARTYAVIAIAEALVPKEGQNDGQGAD